ncbi:MAG: SDR family NAD(P)-dependent oxidoreductase [Actinobacteria bacterium]|nr:SDR family NAD(P)-dependent oxidoreductase [Actinomycetota bacterium]
MSRTVLVTGANSGVGLATSLHLAHLGFDVVGTVRSQEKAEWLKSAAADAGVEVETDILDVTDGSGCERVVARHEPWGIVNNAGYMNVGRVADVEPEEALHQLHAMVVAPMRLATLALPSMRRRGGGRIVNVSSVTAHATAPMTGWYQATKHALSAVSDALRQEVAADGIEVVLIEPGGLRTGISPKARDDLLRRRPGSTDRTAYDRSLTVLGVVQPVLQEPTAAAAAIGEALTAGRPRAHYRVGADAAVIKLLNVVLPTQVKDRLGRAAIEG